MAFDIIFDFQVPDGVQEIIIPGGIATPHGHVASLSVSHGSLLNLREETTGQMTKVFVPEARDLSITWHFDRAAQNYPDEMFTPHPSRFTRFAEDLLYEAEAIAEGYEAVERARALACAVAERFTYGHPEETFNQGLEEVPALGCGLVEGSCVDINTYFIAALRAVGIEAGYVTGFYFPAEKAGRCTDGHCWVVTRVAGKVQEWDIAHHLKMGTRDIHPGLNPKPGFRAATFHSMGLQFPQFRGEPLKALIHPVAIRDGRAIDYEPTCIRLQSAGVKAAE